MNSQPTSLVEALELFDLLLDEEKITEARAALDLAKKLATEDDDVEIRLAEAHFAYEAEGPDAAIALIKALVRDVPDSADAWYSLGLLHVDEENDKEAVSCFLRVHDLDVENDIGEVEPAILERIEEVARDLIDALPPELGKRLLNVPIVLEDRPSRAIVEEGFDPRALGLFDGNEDGSDPAPVPTRIVLYTTCLVDAFGPTELDEELDELDAQVEITVLHELGHYFGLSEEEVENLGLG